MHPGDPTRAMTSVGQASGSMPFMRAVLCLASHSIQAVIADDCRPLQLQLDSLPIDGRHRSDAAKGRGPSQSLITLPAGHRAGGYVHSIDTLPHPPTNDHVCTLPGDSFPQVHCMRLLL